MLEAFAIFISNSLLSQWVQAAYWLWPVLEILHFVGLALLFGGLLIVDLRLAGYFRMLEPLAVQRLLPLVVAGFALNLLTGILFFHGDPLRYAANVAFLVKMALVGVAGVNALFYHWKVYPLVSAGVASGASPVLAKCVAWTSLSVWLGVLLCGRLIPYLGTG